MKGGWTKIQSLGERKRTAWVLRNIRKQDKAASNLRGQYDWKQSVKEAEAEAEAKAEAEAEAESEAEARAKVPVRMKFNFRKIDREMFRALLCNANEMAVAKVKAEAEAKAKAEAKAEAKAKAEAAAHLHATLAEEPFNADAIFEALNAFYRSVLRPCIQTQ